MHTDLRTSADSAPGMESVLQNATPATSPDVKGKRPSSKPGSPPAPMSSALMSRRPTAHFIERGRQRELSGGAETQRHKLLVKGLSRLSSSALYEGYKVQLAARETARQRLLLTAWEIEEAKHLLTFLRVMHAEDEKWLGLAEDQLLTFREIFLQRSETEVGGDRDYLQAVYEDECKVIRITGAEANDLGDIFGKHLKHTVSRFTRDHFSQDKDGSCIGDEDVSKDSDGIFEGTSEGSVDMGIYCHRDRGDENLDNCHVDSTESDD